MGIDNALCVGKSSNNPTWLTVHLAFPISTNSNPYCFFTSLAQMSRFSGTAAPSHSLHLARGTKRKRQLSQLPSDSINPLSHPPAVLKQFHVAGFSNTEPLPSDSVADFPHRPWKDVYPTPPPADTKSGSSRGSNHTLFRVGAFSHKKGGNGEGRLVSSIRECVQVCLERGDVHRARKAMAGLAYATKHTSETHSGTFPWSMRAEFIINDDGGKPESSLQLEDGDGKAQPGAWDSGKTMSRLREYLSSLIAEQSKGISNAVSAPLLNLWWALLSSELYGAYSAASYMEREGDKISVEESDPDSPGVSKQSGRPRLRLGPWDSSENTPRKFDIEEKGRDTALGTVETTVQHLERLVHSKPYKTDQHILHLYAAALLFLADLKTPPRLGPQMEQSGVYQERVELRNQARDILDGIIGLGGHIDHRLQRVLDAPFDR